MSCTVNPHICTCTSVEKRCVMQSTVYPHICTCTSEEKQCVMHCLPAHLYLYSWEERCVMHCLPAHLYLYTSEEKRCVMHCLPAHLCLYICRETMCHALYIYIARISGAKYQRMITPNSFSWVCTYVSNGWGMVSCTDFF